MTPGDVTAVVAGGLLILLMAAIVLSFVALLIAGVIADIKEFF